MKHRKWKKFGIPTGVRPKDKVPYLKGLRAHAPNGPVKVIPSAPLRTPPAC